MYMRKENGKRESPYKGILKFADEKKPQRPGEKYHSTCIYKFGAE